MRRLAYICLHSRPNKDFRLGFFTYARPKRLFDFSLLMGVHLRKRFPHYTSDTTSFPCPPPFTSPYARDQIFVPNVLSAIRVTEMEPVPEPLPGKRRGPATTSEKVRWQIDEVGSSQGSSTFPAAMNAWTEQ